MVSQKSRFQEMRRGSVCVASLRTGLWVFLALMLSIGVTMIGGVSKAVAQPAADAPKFDELPIPEALDPRGKPFAAAQLAKTAVRELQSRVNRILINEDPISGNETDFDNYFNKVHFARWTHIANIENTEKNAKDEVVDNFNFLPKQRKEFFTKFLNAQRSQEVHDHLVRITLAKMLEIAKGNFHPVARLNAMVVIGELNLREAVTIGNNAAPIPYPNALPAMITEMSDPKQLDPVKVAAMRGILRHLEHDGRQPQKDRLKPVIITPIETACLELVNAKEPPANRSMAGHVWMQRLALEVLTYLGTLSTNVNIATTIEGLVSDQEKPVLLRCSAAEALGQLNLPPATNLNAATTASKLGELALFACKNEIKRLEDERLFYENKIDWQKASGIVLNQGGPQPMQPPPGKPSKDKKVRIFTPDDYKYKLQISQRRIKSHMYSVAVGLEGAKGKGEGISGLAKADPALAAYVTSITNEVAVLRDFTDDAADLDAFLEQLKAHSKTLEDLTKAQPAVGKKPPKGVNDDDDLNAGVNASKPAAAPKAPAKPVDPLDN